MDLFSHAIAGASVGLAFGHPITGAVCACLPDLVLGIKRASEPSEAYIATHSLAFVGVVGALGWALGFGWLPFLAVLSHILVDVPTHSPKFAPALLYPFRRKRFSLGTDWEWFNSPWYLGLFLTTLWSAAWLIVP